MTEKFLKKIIAQSPNDLKIISALCSESYVKQSDIKYLKYNKVFLISLHRISKENSDVKQKLNSIIKFEFIEDCKSKNIDQNNKENILQLLVVDLFKKNDKYEMVLLFKNNEVITLTAEVVEVTLEDIKY